MESTPDTEERRQELQRKLDKCWHHGRNSQSPRHPPTESKSFIFLFVKICILKDNSECDVIGCPCSQISVVFNSLDPNEFMERPERGRILFLLPKSSSQGVEPCQLSQVCGVLWFSKDPSLNISFLLLFIFLNPYV